MKFKSESEFCKHVTEVILGILTGEGHIQAIPEAPKGYFSNWHFDMLIIDRNRKRMFAIEYKLNDLKGLWEQVNIKSIHCRTIGIINRSEIPKNGDYSYIYPYTGKDWQIEKLARRLLVDETFWSPMYHPFCVVYWYAYINEKSSLNGGLKECKRPTFHHIYIKAIKNLQKAYNYKLDFMAVYMILNCGYAPSTAEKYYKKVMRNKR